MMHLYKVIIFLILGSSSVVTATEFEAQICSNHDLLNCIDTTQSECETSFSRSKIKCIEKYMEHYDLKIDKHHGTITKLGQCISSGFANSVGISEDKLLECDEHIETAFLKYKSRVHNKKKSLKTYK